MSEDGLGVSHQLRFDAIADADPRQLGLLEVPVDPIAVGVDDRDIGAALMGKIADPHQEVRDVAIDWAANLGSAQIDLCLRHLLLRCFERGFRLHRGAGEGLLFLRGGREIREPLSPLGLRLLDLQISRLLPQLGPIFLQRHFKVERIDHVEHVAFVNVLIVADPEFYDLAGDLRRNACDLHADAAVSRPWRRDIIVPCHQGHDDGDERDRQGCKPLEASEDPSKRKPSSTRRATSVERPALTRCFLRLGLNCERLNSRRLTPHGRNAAGCWFLSR